MRILILGGAGMLGHKLYQLARERGDTWVTTRSSYREYAKYDLFDCGRTITGVEVSDFDSILRTFATVRPDVVVNCIGIIKQLSAAQESVASLNINSLLPHRLESICRAAGARLVHISTDCVFSGRKGMYTEEDISDAEDLYGRTKFLGEVNGSGCLTLRTSIIGRELKTRSGLVEWFLSNRGGKVNGYQHAIYSGLTTLVLGQIILNILEHHPQLTGVYQVSSDSINKYDLLCLIRDEFDINIEIEATPYPSIDRSLDSSRFRSATGIIPPEWPAMIQEMSADPTPYERWRDVNESAR